jgi:hypothetical protein
MINHGYFEWLFIPDVFSDAFAQEMVKYLHSVIKCLNQFQFVI